VPIRKECIEMADVVHAFLASCLALIYFSVVIGVGNQILSFSFLFFVFAFGVAA
jgi:hypothetical protein